MTGLRENSDAEYGVICMNELYLHDVVVCSVFRYFLGCDHAMRPDLEGGSNPPSGGLPFRPLVAQFGLGHSANS
jgi:hypothetical protein